MAERTKFLCAAFFILTAILFLYHPSLHYDFSGLDDNELVVRNPDIKELSFDRIRFLLTKHYITLYVPVTMISYLLDYQIWHLTPFGFRFTNVVLHFFNSLLVLLLVRSIHKNFILACVMALMFALHPVQIESVVWIAERKNVLSAFFLFPAVLFYWKAGKPGSEKHENRWLWLALLAYVAGMLSKPNTVVFLPLILAINYFFFNGIYGFKSRFWFYGILAILSFVFTVLTIQGTAASVEQYSFHGGSYKVNLFVMLTVFWRYLQLLFYPVVQNILYSSRAYYSLLQAPVLLSAVGLIGFFFILWFNRGRNPGVSFWLSWFVITLLPVSNLIAPLPSIMNDRYLYIPMIGIFMAFFLSLERLSKNLIFHFESRMSKWSTVTVVSLLVVPFILVGFQRIPDWKNPDTLWESAFRRMPRKDPRIYYFAGINQIDRGHFERAIELFKESIAMDPTIDTHLALGTACAAADRLEEAEFYLKKVIEMDPDRAGAYDQLGAVYRKTYRYEEAEKAYQKALAIEPRSAVIYSNYALLLMDLDQPEQARSTWEHALKLDPDCHFALRNLSWFHYLRGNLEPAAHYLIRYLRRDPNDLEMRNMAASIQLAFDKVA